MNEPSRFVPKREDYWHIGPVYVWKWAAVLGLLAVSLAVLAAFGLPEGLFSGTVREIPTYCYQDPALAEASGVVRITDKSGVVRYEGEVVQGACTGTGRVYDAAGELVYSGPLLDGVYQGADAKVYAGGILIYEGEMANNRYEGQGRRIDPDSGIVSEGNFSNGVLTGEGQEFAADGTLLRAGTFADDLLHGSGVQYTKDGVIQYEGEFQRGLRHGQGTLYDPLLGVRVYEGAFWEDRPTGWGKIYHPSGQLLYQGNVYDGAPRADAFLGLSLAEVEEAFSEHWVLYFWDEAAAFVYPDFHLMFITHSPVELTSPGEQDAQARQERQELLAALSAREEEDGQSADAAESLSSDPVGANGDRTLSDGTEKKDILIAEVLSYGEALAGTAQPDLAEPSGSRAAGWREWFSDFAAGKPVSGAAVAQTGPFVYEFTPSQPAEDRECVYYLAAAGGVCTTTVLWGEKDGSLRYQSAEREATA